MPTNPEPIPSYVMRRPSSASRGNDTFAVLVTAMALQLMAGVSYAGNGLPWFYFLGNLKIGPFPSQRLCKDDDGSCHFEHGPGCLIHDGKACAPIGPGFGVFGDTTDWPACLQDGRCEDLCSADCVSEGYPKGFYYVVVAPDGALSLAGPYSKRVCMKLSDECLSIGAIPNTEGSRGGP